ncbi:hypothetical protein JL722_10860 [Aureococcus anophagefferens]|nr:hypothetical protein JL722_10860 [Aureococcus anophagefferens]
MQPSSQSIVRPGSQPIECERSARANWRRAGEAPKVAPEGMVDHGHDFVSEIEAALRSAGGQLLQDRDADSFRSLPDRLAYFCENLIAMNSFAAFYILATAFVVLASRTLAAGTSLRYERDAPLRDGGYAGGERRLSNRGALNRGDMAAVRDTLGYKSFSDSAWMAPRSSRSAGSDPSLPTLALLRCVYLSMIICGLVVFAVLVGFITESVESFMRSLAAGRTKVVEHGHALILGTSEATPRVVTQLALMRKRSQKGAALQRRRDAVLRRVVGLTVAAADDLLDRGSIIAVSSSLPGAKPELCPPPDTVIKAEDAVIFVAETPTPKATPRDAAFVSTRAEGARRPATQDETRSRLRRTRPWASGSATHGDAADVALLRRIVMNIPIETAIVLGTNARALGDPLAPKMRDTRVLNILLTLRHLRAASPFAAEHMHVIGENAIDETRMLALTPESGREPDFINTQAIFARALALRRWPAAVAVRLLGRRRHAVSLAPPPYKGAADREMTRLERDHEFG